jgi:hypothetical protein
MSTKIARPFFFLHIRKTAGTSLRGLLANRFPANSILFQAHSVSGPQQPGDALFATGHVGFDYAQRFRVAPKTFTVMREPISLALSGYYFFQKHDEQFFRVLESALNATEYQSRRHFYHRARHLSMLQFLVEEESLARAWLSNIQTRQLAGISCAGLADDDPRLIETALDHLGEIDLVGIVERLDDTLPLLAQMMDWGRLGPLQHLNITDRSETADVDPRCVEILRSWNLLDLRLYEEALCLFELKAKAFNASSPAERTAVTAWPVEGDVFTPDQPIYGYGWHDREYYQGRWLCWNSMPEATLDLSFSTTKASKFHCLLTHVINEIALENLQITLNSVPLTLQKREDEAGGILLESDIPAKGWGPDPRLAQLTFTCPIMQRPCDMSTSTDKRSLGVAIGWLRFN